MKGIKGNLERVKTALIVLLSVSGVLLGLRTGLLDRYIQLNGLYTAIGDIIAPEEEDEEVLAPAAWPTGAMVGIYNESGEYFGYRMNNSLDGSDGPSLRELYDLFSPNLREALGSSGIPEGISLEMWEEALSGAGIFFCYDIELPAEVLAKWLGTEIGGADGLIKMLYLGIDEDEVGLYYMGTDGKAYRCSTAVVAESIREKVSDIDPNGAEYAFQNDAYVGVDRYSILIESYDRIQIIGEENAGSLVYKNISDILSRLGINNSLAKTYDNGSVIVEEDVTVRIGEDGSIVYQNRGESQRLIAGDGNPNLPQAIECARQIADILHLLCDAAEVYLTGWELTDEGYKITFGYYIDGLAVHTSTPAAEIVISNGYVTEAALHAKQYYRSGLVSGVIPEVQAAAASGGKRIVLAYVQDSQGEGSSYIQLRPKWLLIPGEEGQNG